MRILVILLLSIMLFFGGVTYGAKEPSIQEPTVVDVEETYPILEVEEKEIDTQQPEEEELAIHRTASILEKIVTSFYEAFIHMIYQFVSQIGRASCRERVWFSVFAE